MTPKLSGLHLASDLTDLSRKILSDLYPAERLRAAWDDDTGRDDRVWSELAQAGLLGVIVPEEYGGLGLTEPHMVGLLRETGYAGLPHPVLESCWLASWVLREAGTDGQRERWLPALAGGQAIATVRFTDGQLVPDAHVADILLVVVDDVFVVVESGDFTYQHVPTFDRARRVFEVDFDVAASSPTRARGPDIVRAFHRGALGAAAFLTGNAIRLIQDTVAYVAERRQFGRPVGSFQAVQHGLADAYAMVDTSRAAGDAAAAAMDDSDSEVGASVAKVQASDASRIANDAALQYHGGIGFAWEHDLHLWLKRGKAWEQSYGSAVWHRRLLASHLFDGDGKDSFDVLALQFLKSL